MAPQATPAAGSGCPHDVRQRVIRWQPVGLSRCTVQRVGVGLRAASRTGNVNNIFIQRAGASPRIKPACRALRVGMLMTGQLRHAQGRGAHSAGKTRSCPPQTAPAAGSGRPHDVRKGIIRRQGGRLPRCSIQRVRMGLRVTDGAGGCGRLPDTRSPATKTARGIPRTSHCMSVAGQLLYRERGLADSAGKTFLIAAMRHNQELFHASSYRSSR
jgi:hypothetical protein